MFTTYLHVREYLQFGVQTIETTSFETIHLRPLHLRPYSLETTFISDNIYLRPHKF